MKKLITTCFLLAISSPVFATNTTSQSTATGTGYGGNGFGGGATSTVDGGNATAIGGVGGQGGLGGNSDQDQTQGQLQSQDQGQHQSNESSNTNLQGQSSTNDASNKGNTQSVNNNYQRPHRNTPSMANFVPMPTSPCMATLGAAAAGSGFGVSISGSYINENCERQEAARMMYLIGESESAVHIACGGKYAAETPMCKQIAIDNAEVEEVSATGALSTNEKAASPERKTFGIRSASDW